jgi:hypothetical protein
MSYNSTGLKAGIAGTGVFGLPQLTNIKLPSIFSLNTAPTLNTLQNNSQASAIQWPVYIGYFFAILAVVIVILLAIHFLITPVFQFTPGGPGIIPVPGTNDGTVYWTSFPMDTIIKNTNLGSISTNWSMSIDIFIEEPFIPPSTTGSTRVILERSSGLLGGNYNVRVALLPNTTDLRVSLLNSVNNEEFIDITNVPVQTPFRLGVIILDRVMEVYINGRLYKTLALMAPPKSEAGGFIGPQGDMATMAKVKNLILWKRPITASEMRYAKPSLAQASEFKPSGMKGAGAGSKCA